MRIASMGRVFVVCALILAPFASSAEDTGVKALDAAWAKAMKAGDVDAVVALYAPDAVLWLPFAPKAVGTMAIRDAYAGMLSANTVVEASFSNESYETRQDLSVGWGQFVLTLKAKKPDGETVIMRGRYTGVARQVSGRWVYVSDHASADPEPAPAPKS